MNKFSFTTSWDDGSVHDLKVAELLSRHGLKGTFYIPETFDGVGGKYASYDRRLTESEIHSLAQTQEIGGHTMSHRRLTSLPLEEASREISDCRDFIQGITGEAPKMFAFPGGAFNESLVEIVREAGFIAARTTRKGVTRIAESAPQVMDVTIVCQPYPFRRVDKNHYYWGKLLEPLALYSPRRYALSWQSLARAWFKKAYADGDYFHLYGHSWEIEKYDMWHELDSFFAFVREHNDIILGSNSEVVPSRK
ncbi:MAG: polysaccharide deacetylase family protein [Candidatus Pacebacteria bacterium]|nr:polysaccharide deacetylase family protein [Candidatus Paceibacterota bacterium]